MVNTQKNSMSSNRDETVNQIISECSTTGIKGIQENAWLCGKSDSLGIMQEKEMHKILWNSDIQMDQSKPGQKTRLFAAKK